MLSKNSNTITFDVTKRLSYVGKLLYKKYCDRVY